MNPLLISMLLGGGVGLLRGSENEKQNKRDAKFREAALRYAPWTKMSDPGYKPAPGMLDSALSGASQGANLGQMLGYKGPGEGTVPAANAQKVSADTATSLSVPTTAPSGGGLNNQNTEESDLYSMKNKQASFYYPKWQLLAMDKLGKIS